MKNAFRLALAFALLASAAAIRAEDFNFTVPVQVSNLPPNVEELTIVCAALAPAATSGAANHVNFETVGYASVRVTIAGGAYRNDVAVRVNASPGKDPRMATQYRCEGTFKGRERGAVVYYFSGGKQQPPVFPLAPGAPFSLSTGELRLPR
jgi:zona occludens toxin (predicted ATPase)